MLIAARSNAARPKLHLRLITGVRYLTHSFNFGDEVLDCAGGRTVFWQYFSGMAYYEYRPPCEATIDTSVAMQAVKPKDLEGVIGDTTRQEKLLHTQPGH